MAMNNFNSNFNFNFNGQQQQQQQQIHNGQQQQNNMQPATTLLYVLPNNMQPATPSIPIMQPIQNNDEVIANQIDVNTLDLRPNVLINNMSSTQTVAFPVLLAPTAICMTPTPQQQQQSVVTTPTIQNSATSTTPHNNDLLSVCSDLNLSACSSAIFCGKQLQQNVDIVSLQNDLIKMIRSYSEIKTNENKLKSQISLIQDAFWTLRGEKNKEEEGGGSGITTKSKLSSSAKSFSFRNSLGTINEDENSDDNEYKNELKQKN
eukprot:45906_1